MNLTTTPDIIQWDSNHYVFVEKIGSNMAEMAQKAWQELGASIPEIAKQNQISKFTSLYKVEPALIYRAGVFVTAKPENLPKGFKYEFFSGGKFFRFTLTGPYTQLPEACGKVFETVKIKKLPLRQDYYLENYVNDPQTTPQEKCITEILVPTH